ncbi:MAG: ClpXP protease specificity-enhancing factor [Betaproteobacteria bacterium]|jgi:stringent starvation protein B|nr:ClpXP protease specificity-enhancing factor [Betaproteobacteria bacterium]MCH9849400.1 ClpXP protease specificity-enhancing factor [Betaproteobacteria bacterium]MDG1096968.1 ClpXP protease specificity-enhancing factor [Methylophilaceae bacterium]MDG1454465.1 ClpXP protease specificity-enhancing factor [Methylophilaceae bacterium]
MANTLGSTKPYMVRAIHEWCVDNALTPHLLVVVNAQTKVPKAFVKNGEIVLNLNYSATKDLHIDNDAVVFSARFGGVAQNLYVPMDAVRGIFARENGQGMFFELGSPAQTVSDEGEAEEADVKKQSKQDASKKRPSLTIVK